ncbi:ECF transporter S component [Lapidilactobacillus luobeiensis]|uniref:ECF transporter S component n=1 Tax=Lapidilactobacillus luobeiensis TaxID=2950371 RepID=UPI0021C2D2B3|nr:ECF transporter S component [Lapidilactobacillus luobeiensis]
MRSGNRLRFWVSVTLFGVLSYCLMLIEIPIPLFPFLKLDFSDLIPLSGLALFGFAGASGVVLIRAVLHLIMTGFSAPALLGELGSVVASFTLLVVTWALLKRRANWQQRLLLILCGTLALTLVMAVLNYFVLTPLYVKVTGFKLGMSYLKYVIFTIVPFNLIKGSLIMALFVLLEIHVGAYFRRKHQEFHRL